LFTIISVIGVTRPYFVKVEEAQCLRHYGAAYQEYMNRTSRWIGIPKSKKVNYAFSQSPKTIYGLIENTSDIFSNDPNHARE